MVSAMTLDEFLHRPGAPKAAVFARQIGCSRSHVMRMRRGERRPSLRLALSIERATGEEVPVEAWDDEDALEAA
jgi:DNA-binding transcriptional regulator YdaS (Cro superfamily)